MRNVIEIYVEIRRLVNIKTRKSIWFDVDSGCGQITPRQSVLAPCLVIAQSICIHIDKAGWQRGMIGQCWMNIFSKILNENIQYLPIDEINPEWSICTALQLLSTTSDWFLMNEIHLLRFFLTLCLSLTNFLYRAEGTNLLLDPHLICKKPRRLRGKLHDICKTDTSLMDEIARGISMGFRECEHQFKHRRWNCSSAIKRNIKKILSRGKFDWRTSFEFHFNSNNSINVCAASPSSKTHSIDTFRHNDFIREHSTIQPFDQMAQNRHELLAGVLFTANWTFVCYVRIVNVLVHCVRWLRLVDLTISFVNQLTKQRIDNDSHASNHNGHVALNSFKSAIKFHLFEINLFNSMEFRFDQKLRLDVAPNRSNGKNDIDSPTTDDNKILLDAF